jgi:hypothetical protein
MTHNNNNTAAATIIAAKDFEEVNFHSIVETFNYETRHEAFIFRFA